MARTIGQESIDLTQVVVDGDALKLIPQDFARRHRLLPIAFDNNERVLTVAITEVFNVVALDQLRATIGQQVKIRTVLAGEAQLEDSIDHFYGHEFSIDGILREIETGEIDYQSLQAAAATSTRSPSCAWSPRCSPTRSSAAPRISTSSPSSLPAHPLPHRRRAASRSAACTRTTGRRWRCA